MLNSIPYTLTQLEYIQSLYKTRHFGKAAAECHVSQPTLSMQIQKFEKDLEVTLFDRSKKPILLTEVGEKIIQQIQIILFEAKKIQNIAHSNTIGEIKGSLNLAVIPTLSQYVIPKLLPLLAKKHPRLELKVFEMQTLKILDSLENDEIDVGWLATPVARDGFYEMALYYEPFYVVCPKNHDLAQFKKIKYNQLTADDVWLLEEGHCLRNQIVDICSLRDKSPKKKNLFSFEGGSIETLKKLINYYGGYTLVPSLALDDLGSKTLSLPFERPIPAREVGLVYRRQHYKNLQIEALADVILQTIPDEIKKIRKKDLDIIPI